MPKIKELQTQIEILENLIADREQKVENLENVMTPQAVEKTVQYKLEIEEAKKRLQKLWEELEQMEKEAEELKQKYTEQYERYTKKREEAEEEITKAVKELVALCKKWENKLAKIRPDNSLSDRYASLAGQHLSYVMNPKDIIRRIIDQHLSGYLR